MEVERLVDVTWDNTTKGCKAMFKVMEVETGYTEYFLLFRNAPYTISKTLCGMETDKIHTFTVEQAREKWVELTDLEFDEIEVEK
jgi:hypothetical protein